MLIDADVHHGALSIVAALGPYLSRTYQERLGDYGFPNGLGPFADDGGVRGWRPDLVPPPVPEHQTPGGAVAWDVGATTDRLFNRSGVDLAILTGGAMDGVQGMPDLDYASALCRAFNNWTRDTWLASDRRYRFAMAICTQDAEGAAKEIDRIGDDEGVCAVLMPTGSARPFGHRSFEPIHAALARHDLPILLHSGGDGQGVFNGITTGSGMPSQYAELVVARHAFYQAHMESLVFEAVFERYPTLKVVLMGSGFTWVPSYLWRMDLDWKGMRWHTPWVKRPPSEYVLEHVRFGSGPFDETPPDGGLDLTLKWVHGGDTLVFGSHFPRWDADDIEVVRDRLPVEMAPRVFGENARDAFRL